MKYKKARSEAEIAAELRKTAPDDDERKSEFAKRCKTLKAKGLLIEQWDLDNIEADLDWCGMSGSPTKVHRIQSVVLSGGEYHEFPPTDDGLAELTGAFIEEHTIG